MLIDLSGIDKDYLKQAYGELETLAMLAPTDAKTFYSLALTARRLGQFDKSIEIMEKAVEMKANYKDARMALFLFYKDEGRTNDAATQLEYVLKNISPNDTLAQEELEKLK